MSNPNVPELNPHDPITTSVSSATPDRLTIRTDLSYTYTETPTGTAANPSKTFNYGIYVSFVSASSFATPDNTAQATPQFTASGYNKATACAQFVGNWTTNGFWGIGQNTAAADNTVRVGTCTAPTGAWTGYAILTAASFPVGSDERLKERLEPIEGALYKIAGLRTVTFNYKDGSGFPASRSVGCIAQDVQKVQPEAVYNIKEEDGETYLGVDYGRMVPLACAAIKELTAIVNDLKSRIAALESK